MKRRGLIIDKFDTAAHGFTMTKLSLQTPQIVEDFLQVDGMHGQIDLCDASGTVVYKSQRLSAVYELSEGSHADRERVITELIRAVHGKKCTIVHPDHPGKLIEGRVQVSKDFNNLAYAQVSVSAICQPWFLEESFTFLDLPILDRSHNRITKENTTFMAELSTCDGGVIGDTEVVTVVLVTNPADVGTYGVFQIALEANQTYYFSAAMLSKGSWYISANPMIPQEFSPIATTGDDGFLYVFIRRNQSYSYVNLNQVICMPVSEVSVLHNGSFPAALELEKPSGFSVLLAVDGNTKTHSAGTAPDISIPAGDIPIVAYRHDTNDEILYEKIKFRRKWLE